VYNVIRQIGLETSDTAGKLSLYRNSNNTFTRVPSDSLVRGDVYYGHNIIVIRAREFICIWNSKSCRVVFNDRWHRNSFQGTKVKHVKSCFACFCIFRGFFVYLAYLRIFLFILFISICIFLWKYYLWMYQQLTKKKRDRIIYLKSIIFNCDIKK